MRIEIKLKEVTLPKKFRRYGSACYLDPYRKTMVQITDEEIVRQKIARYFVDQIGVPFDNIQTEQPTSRYSGIGRGRMDIVIEALYENATVQPIACIECKAEHIALTSHVCSQAERYAKELDLKYYFTTNGIELFGYAYDHSGDKYVLMKDIPSYKEMIESKHTIAKVETVTKRTPFSMLQDVEKESYLHFIGEDTPSDLSRDIVNIGECLLDTSTRLSSKDHGYFKVVEDIGVRFLGYGDASGSDFGTGKYRTIVIEDKNNNHQLISIGVMPNAKTSNDPKYGNRKGNSVLVVAIDDYQKTHTSLQLNMSEYLKQGDEFTEVVHSGRIAIGNIGSGKIAELKDLISIKAPALMKDNEIYLGKFRNNQLAYINDTGIEVLILNLITYALIRDEYRDIRKKEYKPKEQQELKESFFRRLFSKKRVRK